MSEARVFSEAEPLCALFVGLGSIGTRHLTNLVDLCQYRGIPLRVTALRSSARALPEETAAMVDEQVTALPGGAFYDLAFVTGPTNLHRQTLADLKGRADCFFIEKPVFDAPVEDLAALGLAESQKAYVAAPMRFTGVYLALQDILASGLSVYSARVICSSYLPGWRPNADYRENYSAKKEMGGGVALDLIHEWDYLCTLFGMPQQVLGMAGRFSNLEITSDDLAVYIARFEKFLCEVHLDYFGREYRRTAEFFTAEGTLVADFGAGTITLPNGTVQDYDEPVNTRYEREMDYFVSYALAGEGKSVNSPAHAQEVLRVALEGTGNG